MGKRLIINGADFSANAVAFETWYNSYTNLQPGNTTSGTKVVVDPDAIVALGLTGKPINHIKLNAAAASQSLSICACQVTSRDAAEYSRTEDENTRQTIPVTIGENDIILTKPITLSVGQSLVFTSTKKIIRVDMNGSSAAADEKGWSFGSGTGWYKINWKCPIMFGYISPD